MRRTLKEYVRKVGVLALIILLIGLALGFVSSTLYWGEPDADDLDCTSSFTFINPNLDCGLSDKKVESFGSLEDKLKQEIALYEQNGEAARIGIFARDLKSTRFVGVNENDMFYMASLLKLPVLIGGYKLAEVEPRILDQEITYTGKPNLYSEQYIKPDQILEVKKSYTVQELMRRAVVYSDNTAAQLLYDYYPPEFIDRIVQALGIEFVRPEGTTENFVTPRTYANIFRTLFYASYLTRAFSNEALSTLTKTTYRDGAVAKLPPGVVVAHKFAERSAPDPSDPSKFTRQLHECGIVYAKNGDEPYSFCIMTEGTDYGELQTILQDLSLEIYNAMTGDTGN